MPTSVRTTGSSTGSSERMSMRVDSTNAPSSPVFSMKLVIEKASLTVYSLCSSGRWSTVWKLPAMW